MLNIYLLVVEDKCFSPPNPSDGAVTYDLDRYVYPPAPFATARAECAFRGGHILQVKTQEQQDYVASMYVSHN